MTRRNKHGRGHYVPQQLPIAKILAVTPPPTGRVQRRVETTPADPEGRSGYDLAEVTHSDQGPEREASAAANHPENFADMFER